MADKTVRSRKAAQKPQSKQSPPQHEQSAQSQEAIPAQPLNQFTWADPGTWGEYKFVPAYVAIFAILSGYLILSRVLPPSKETLDLSSPEICAATFDYGYPINAVLAQGERYSTQSWEIAAQFDAQTQIFAPQRSVFDVRPFPDGRPPGLGFRQDRASDYVANYIKTKAKVLFEDDREQTLSGPAALGVAALMTGQRWKDRLEAADAQLKTLWAAPKASNGALSNRADRVEVAAEAIGRIAPFLAYYGVVHSDVEVMRDAVKQISLHRETLAATSGKRKGLWKRSSADDGVWSLGNAVAAYGIAQVRATLSAWPTSNATMHAEIAQLDSWILEILSGAASNNDDKKSGLLREYLGDASSSGEAAGTALLAATTYRMALLRPEQFATSQLLTWAHGARQAVIKHVDDDGFVSPATGTVVRAPHADEELRQNVLVSPEAQSYLLLLGNAWRDFVCRGLGVEVYLEETGMELITPKPFLERWTGKQIEDKSLNGILDAIIPDFWSLIPLPQQARDALAYFKAP